MTWCFWPDVTWIGSWHIRDNGDNVGFDTDAVLFVDVTGHAVYSSASRPLPLAVLLVGRQTGQSKAW